MYKNKVKELLANHQPVLGCILQGAFPPIVEILGLAGFHFVFIDAEHYPFPENDIENLFRAAEVRHLIPFIRTPAIDEKIILKYLDMGAMGIIIPGIRTSSEAEAAVLASKYYPDGNRGFSSTRSSDYGFCSSKVDYMKQANQETMVISVIETKEALDNLEEIVAIDGMDAFLLGTSDLSIALGVPGQTNHPLVEAAFTKLLQAGKKYNKPVGNYLREGQSPKDFFDKGAAIAMTSVNSLLKAACVDFVKKGLAK